MSRAWLALGLYDFQKNGYQYFMFVYVVIEWNFGVSSFFLFFSFLSLLGEKNQQYLKKEDGWNLPIQISNIKINHNKKLNKP